jgi:hypothetical protein
MKHVLILGPLVNHCKLFHVLCNIWKRGCPMIDSFEILARDEADMRAAREAIWRALDTDDGHRTVYAALCRWTWRAMIERRLDEELRSWHRLLLDTAGRMATQAESKPHIRDRGRLDRSAASERVRALADLVRMSVEAANASVLKDLTARAHVAEILRLLAGHASKYFEREQIKNELGLRDSNLSRVLTLLAANGLVERLAQGKAAAFRITQRGLALADIDSEERAHFRAEIQPLLTPTKQVQEDTEDAVFKPINIVVLTPKQNDAPPMHWRFLRPHQVHESINPKSTRALGARHRERVGAEESTH